MRTIYKSVLFLIISISILIFSSCENSTSTFGNWLVDNYDLKTYSKILKDRFSENEEFDICFDQFEYFDTLCRFYNEKEFSPIWTKDFIFNNNVDTILGFYSKVTSHGLDSNIFDASLIRYYRNLIIQKAKFDSVIDYKGLATLELLISNSLLSYSKTMQCGVLNPLEIFPKDHFLPINQIDSGTFFLPLKVLDIGVYLRDIQPNSPRYISLQKSLDEYRNIEKYAGWDSIINVDEELKIEIGDTSSLLNSIAKRLIATHELDSLYTDSLFKTYDSILFNAVVKYQINNGLLSDGVIGKRTIEQMNVSGKDRIKQICINLERFRWYNYPDTGRYVMVNIPAYYLYAYEEQKQVLDMRVCVGGKREKNYDEKLKNYLKTKNKKLKPNNHETPCMYGKLTHFVLNPKWLVPKSIGEKEIIYKLIKDSMYLEDQNMKVFLDGVELDPDTINWSNYSCNSLPFRFRQEAGELNALGKMKFIFKNKFDIYLHDTPSKSKFLSSYRAVSHGCVRIQEPMQFIDFLLETNDKLELDDIRMDLGLKPIDDTDEKKFKKRMKEYKEKQEELKELDEPPPLKTKSIFINENIYVYIDYFTSWTDSLGILQFRQDVYDKDRIIKKLLF